MTYLNFVSVKKISARILLILITFIDSICIHARGGDNNSSELRRNSIGGYIGLFEYNINYERNILQRPKSFSNLRVGFGIINSSLDGGYYYNPSLVHMTGKRNSHLELDLGFKYTIQKGSSNSFLPDLFAGYRYEKPYGKLLFRVGINLYTLYNIGIGIKF